jgi:hypothetical protein
MIVGLGGRKEEHQQVHGLAQSNAAENQNLFGQCRNSYSSRRYLKGVDFRMAAFPCGELISEWLPQAHAFQTCCVATGFFAV